MLAAVDDVLNAISQGFVLVTLIPIGYFTIDYAILRPFRKGRDANGVVKHKYVPWWKSGIGVMFVMLGSSLFFTDLVVSLSLWLGIDYPGRQVIRVFLYGYCMISIFVLAIVYGLEGRKRQSVLMSNGGE